MPRPDATTRHESVLRELHEERAAALFRISRTLEALIGQLHDARERVESADSRGRPEATAHYRALRARALEYRWYLEVQRDALGLHGPDRLDEFYRIPGPID